MSKSPSEQLRDIWTRPSTLPTIALIFFLIALISGLIASSLEPVDETGRPSLTSFGIGMLIVTLVTAPSAIIALFAAIAALVVWLRRSRQQ